MAEQTGGVIFENRGLNLRPRLTYAQAVLAQAALPRIAQEALPEDRTYFFIELGSGAPRVRGIDEKDSLELDAEAYKLLAGAAEGGRVDLVLGDAASIDLSFEVPPGLLPEVKKMIEAEITYRSPFTEGVALAIWEAHETTNRGWKVTAALTLEKPVEEILNQLEKHGATIASVIRETPKGVMRTAPPWLIEPAFAKPSLRGFFGALSPSLKAAIAGSALFALSALSLWGVTGYQDWTLAAEARQAQTTLRNSAAAATRLRSLDNTIAQSTAVLAVTGKMSELLPDSVWLDQIIADGTELTLVGFAPSAAEVTRLLSTMSTLSDIKFASPVIRDNSQSIERFRISATLLAEDTQ
ncbi:MAG: PilN domain-containing protein [Pseudomonadota bacterium]